MENEKIENPELHPDWSILPTQLKAKLLGKENCFGDHEKINGNSAECQKCPLWTDCLKASLHQVLTVYDVIHEVARE